MSSYPTEQMAVKITVNTTITNGSEKETYELITFGQYIQKTSSVFLRYDELMEEGSAKTVVKVTGQEEGSILRNGAVDMRLPFQANQTLVGSYKTPYGVLDMETSKTRISHEYDDVLKKGLINIMYDLKMQGNDAGTYHVSITFEEDEKDEHSGAGKK
ncbi:DUF1934 domain-containing protein [Bacillus tuaregi]|uniref:DUF1934 domain-containing protein n=1 Tax=Bacillus tuaregi TaxID=1816695 RepID=UPI0008F91F88|nr:DUF1934 domain-containing protein [Bacillus tuaregi]